MVRAQITITCGPARCGKTESLLARYRAKLSKGSPGCGMWLTPTNRAIAQVRARLVGGSPTGGGLSGCLRPQVITFDKLARDVLAASNTPVQLLTGSHRRQLIRRLVNDAAEQNQLRYFAGIADTDGLIRQVEGFITELKRLEIWPHDLRQSCQARGMLQKDREFLALYEGYQDALQKHELFDAEGCAWAARANLKAGQVAPYEALQLVVVDGFTDFTRTQHEILEALAKRVDELVISLPLEQSSQRPELFAKSRQTLDDLRQRYPECRVDHLAGNPSAQTRNENAPAISRLAETLFIPAREQTPLASTSGIDVIAAAQQIGEVREVARRVKQLLVGSRAQTSVRPADVAVVYRSLRDMAPLVREVFAEYGVPVAIENREPLAHAPILAALQQLLRLNLEDWSYRELLATITHNGLRPGLSDTPSEAEWSTHMASVQAAEQTIRYLQIPQGRSELTRAATRLAEQASQLTGDSGRTRRSDLARTRAAVAAPLLQRLDEALARLPDRASLQDWAAASEAMLRELGHLREDDSVDVQADIAAASKFVGALEAAHQLDDKLGAARKYDLQQILGVIQDTLDCESLPTDVNATGCVRVLTAPGARTLEVPYLFVAGLAEQAFPPPLEGGRLYSDAETARLIADGLPLPSRQQRSFEEMLLFYEVVTRATRRLTLSYPATDARGEPLLPSPYLGEIIRICGAAQLGLKSIANLRPLPEIDQPHSPMEMRVQAVEDAVDGDTSRLASIVEHNPPRSGAANLLPAIASVQSRGDRDYGPFEGVLSSATAQARLHEHFGPHRAWSPSHLEQYAACPHQFYLERVLGLEPLADLALEDDYMIRGSLLHHTLATVHRSLNEQKGEAFSPTEADAEQFVQQFAEAVDGLLEKWGSPGAVERALRSVDRRTLIDWAENYIEQHVKYDGSFRDLDGRPRPELFEISFGLSRSDEDDDRHSTQTPLELREGDHAVHIAGRVDRVDVGECAGVPVFNVIDYKSGSKVLDKKEQIEAGLALQLPLYAMAVEALGLVAPGALPWQAGYWRVKKGGFPVKKPLTFSEAGDTGPQPTAEWQQLQDVVVRRVMSLVKGIRQAEFPVHSADEKCTTFCAFSKICRVNHARSLGKLWGAPGDAVAANDNAVEGEATGNEDSRGEAKSGSQDGGNS